MEFDTDRPEILDGIGQTVRFRCAQEFPGVPWGEMEALSPFEVPCYCPSGDHEVHWETDQIVRDAVEFRDKELTGLLGCTESEIFNADQNECRKYDAFLATASQDTLNKYAFFNRTESEADFNHWGGMPYWTPEEAVALILGKDPKRVSPFIKGFRNLKELLDRAIEVEDLPKKPTPRQSVEWAKKIDFEIPADLEEVLEQLELPSAPTGGEFDEESETYPLELHIAVKAWSVASRQTGSTDTPKELVREWVTKWYPKLSTAAVERIAVVCNWEKKGGRKKEE